MVWTVPARGDDAAKQYAEILKPYNDLLAKFHAATDPTAKAQLALQAGPLIADAVPKLLDLARQFPRSPTAPDALLWIVTKGRRSIDEAKEAKKLLVADYLANERIGHFCLVLETDRANGEQYLREIRARNPSPRVKLLAALSIGNAIAEKSLPPEEQVREAETLLTEVIAEGRKLNGFPEESVLAAEKALFELRNLTVGKPAPELDGITVEGQRAKLSDYRGKVLVVMVWATHAQPAVAIVPTLQALASKHAGKPLALLSIAVDAEKSRLTDFLKKTPLPWDQWWNGQKGGVLEAWNVKLFPTIYVLDAKGVIRHKNLIPKQLDEAVDALLNEKK